MSPHAFLTCFQKTLHAVKLLDCCWEKELDDMKAKICFFHSFPQDHIRDCLFHGHCDFNTDIMKDLKNFFQGHFDAIYPRKNCFEDKDQASHCQKVSFTNHDISNNDASSSNSSSCWSPNLQLLLLWSATWHQSATVQNPCGFCKDTYTIKWAHCKMHNPVTGTKTAKVSMCYIRLPSHQNLNIMIPAWHVHNLPATFQNTSNAMLQEVKPLSKSKRIIDYTWTICQNTMTITLFWFFTGSDLNNCPFMAYCILLECDFTKKTSFCIQCQNRASKPNKPIQSWKLRL